MVSFKTHVSQPSVAVGLMILQYSFNFDFLETYLLLKKNWFGADHSFPFNAEFKMSGTAPPLLVYVLVMCVGKILLSLYQNVRLSKAVRCSSFITTISLRSSSRLECCGFQTSRSGLPPNSGKLST